MKTTNNYNLLKPEKTDYYNVEDQNNNMNTIDEVLSKKVQKIDGKGLSTEDYTTSEKNKLAKIYDWAMEKFALIGHNHDISYSNLSHNHNAEYLLKSEKAIDSDKLDGKDSTAFANSNHNHDSRYERIISKKSGFNLDKSDSVTSTSTSVLATVKAVKTAYDKASNAYNLASNKLGITAKAADSNMLDGVQGINKFNITSHTQAETNRNPNSFREPGIYRIPNIVSNLPDSYISGNNDFILVVTRIQDENPSWVQQKLLDIRSNREFTRRELGGVWEASWSEVFHQNNYGNVLVQTGSQTLNATHRNTVLVKTGGGTITIPANLFLAGDQITVIRSTTGAVSFSPGTGLSLLSVDNKRRIANQFGSVTLVFRTPTQAYIIGALE